MLHVWNRDEMKEIEMTGDERERRETEERRWERDDIMIAQASSRQYAFMYAAKPMSLAEKRLYLPLMLLYSLSITG